MGGRDRLGGLRGGHGHSIGRTKIGFISMV